MGTLGGVVGGGEIEQVSGVPARPQATDPVYPSKGGQGVRGRRTSALNLSGRVQ